ncbi:MAG: leucine-rich repeat domain-containing protein, partial [Bacteroidales bacterium]|nr:leucine-rich repeat domain-containing protein [Bacteroidales bacterium]
TTVSNETVRAYMAVQPVDFSDKTVTATLYTSNGSYSAQVVSREVKKGSAAFLRFAGDFTPSIIEFADAEVKRLCVENWDTDGDGELSYQEAAAVTDLGEVFWDNQTITTFNELEYFTGLTSIGDDAFGVCESLTSVVIPEGVTGIGESAFHGCDSLKSILIPEGVASIGDGAFSSCSSLTSIVIPEGVTSIGGYAFTWCSSLTSIVIPEGVTSIGDGLFSYCSSLTSIVIPEGVTIIGHRAFADCSRLSVFYGKFASVDGRCLIVDGCLTAFAPYDVASYTIPEGVVSIGDDAFHGCRSLTSIVIPEGVTSIGDEAFAYCDSLTSIVIPEGVTSIGSYAFDSCSSLTSIVIPEGVASIGEGAFSGCSSLTSVVIPDSVTSIGYYSFGYCTTLFKIECKSQTPPTAGGNMFYKTNNCPIYVQNESVEAYKAAPGWSDYAGRIFGIVE